MNVGVLLPKSTTIPLIAHDFMGGLESFADFHQIKDQLQFFKENIGFGIESKTNIQAAERLLLDEKVDVLIAFLDHPNVDALYTLIAHVNKPMIVVNHGAKYPLKSKPPKGVVFHTLGEAWHSWNTGLEAARVGEATGMCTSFYDGGYHMFHASSESFSVTSAKEPAFNYISRHNAPASDYLEIAKVLSSRPDVRNLLGTYSGDQAHFFLSALRQVADPATLTVYGSPMLFDESLPELFGELTIPYKLKGHTGWLPGLDNPENKRFVAEFDKYTTRRATHSGALGWDTGLLLHDLLRMGAGVKGSDYVLGLVGRTLSGAKGDLILDPQTAYILGPSYPVYADAGFNLHQDGSLENGLDTWKEMLNNRPEIQHTGWVNTYLCS
jgi:branched-chain amino acid transport system substrate-binding protein